MSLAEVEIERLAARVAELEREKAALESFAAVAAHELVEPLVMTEAYASIISDRLEGPEHADSRRDLDALSRGVSRMRLLVETLLHDARAARREVKRRPVDLGALLRDCVALLRPEIEARDARVEVGKLPAALGEESLLSGPLEPTSGPPTGSVHSGPQGSPSRAIATPRGPSPRACCTAGSSRAIRTAMMAITTSSSISVNPRRTSGRRDMSIPPQQK